MRSRITLFQSLLARPIVDFINDLVKLFLGKGVEGYFFREVLPYQPVGVFVQPPLP
jgi:hypothetical protein